MPAMFELSFSKMFPIEPVDFPSFFPVKNLVFVQVGAGIPLNPQNSNCIGPQIQTGHI